MRILNWNTQADRLRVRTPKFAKARELIAGYGADVICLTEALPESMPDGGHSITSELSDWKHEGRGARKVVLWSRFGWKNIDTIGSDALPEGRFICASTECDGAIVNFIGMCIPYHGYRNHQRWHERRKRYWQGACEYLDSLRVDILPQSRFQKQTILLGDFNLQIPPHRYPGKNTDVNRKREATFDGWSIPTAGEWNDPALDRRFIDHVAHTPDLKARSMHFFSRIAADGSELSDHNGVCIEIESC